MALYYPAPMPQNTIELREQKPHVGIVTCFLSQVQTFNAGGWGIEMFTLLEVGMRFRYIKPERKLDPDHVFYTVLEKPRWDGREQTYTCRATAHIDEPV